MLSLPALWQQSSSGRRIKGEVRLVRRWVAGDDRSWAACGPGASTTDRFGRRSPRDQFPFNSNQPHSRRVGVSTSVITGAPRATQRGARSARRRRLSPTRLGRRRICDTELRRHGLLGYAHWTRLANRRRPRAVATEVLT